jgi:hypothetical protein
VKGRGAAAFFLFGVLAGSAAGQTQAKAKAASASPLDFSGTWKLDEAASANVSPNMIGAILVVEQKGDHIRVTPAPQGAGKVRLAGDEIVVDGRPYEKSVGGAKGVLTARWSADGKALELELSGTAPEKGPKMIQTVSWSLSADGSTWLRETRTAGQGRVRVTRLVFRRQKPEPSTKSPPAKPPKNQS